MDSAMHLDSIYAAYQLDNAFEPLRRQGSHFVPGNGNPNAELFFVGEAPGYNEDRQRKPFVGKAGKILSTFLNEIELKKEDVFLTNVLKYRPDRTNRDPTVPEIQAGLQYLANEIEAINPKLIIALGNIPCRAFVPGLKPVKVRGKIIKYGKHKLLVTHHPMAVVHKDWAKAEISKHFRLIKEVIDI